MVLYIQKYGMQTMNIMKQEKRGAYLAARAALVSFALFLLKCFGRKEWQNM